MFQHHRMTGSCLLQVGFTHHSTSPPGFGGTEYAFWVSLACHTTYCCQTLAVANLIQQITCCLPFCSWTYQLGRVCSIALICLAQLMSSSTVQLSRPQQHVKRTSTLQGRSNVDQTLLAQNLYKLCFCLGSLLLGSLPLCSCPVCAAGA